jgi:hypothetical protein
VKTRLSAFVLLVLTACTTEAQKRDIDKAKLERIVELDQAASNAMKEADDLAIKGNPQGALERLDARAKPSIGDAIRNAENAEMGTPWGKTKRDELLGVIRERSKEMPGYEEAVKSGDAAKLLSAMEAQAGIERRALAAVAGIKDGR